MVTTLKRIRVGSAFKVGVVLNGAIFLLFGLIFIALPLLLLGSARDNISVYTSPDARQLADFIGTASILSLACLYIVGTIGAGIMGGIVFAVSAWLYNLTARWVGGIEVILIPVAEPLNDDDVGQDVTNAQKRKRL